MSRCKRFLELIACGKPEEAAEGILKEMLADPGYRGGIFMLGLAYDGMGLRKLAAGTVKLYVELEPAGYWASHARAKLVEWDLNAGEDS